MMGLLLGVLVAASPGDSASASDVAKAKELFSGAQKLYKAGRFAEAVAKFEEAYSVRPHPSIFFNIGKCYEQLDDVPKALRSFRDYLRLASDPPDRQAVSDTISNLERRLRDRGLQQLIIFTEPTGAYVSVDGKELGKSPASIEIIAGAHKIVAKAEGFAQAERQYSMSISRASEVTLNLVPASADTKTPPPGDGFSPPPPPPPDAPKNDGATLTPNTAGAGSSPSTATPSAGKGRKWTWVAAGISGVGLLVGAGFGVASNLNRSEYIARPHSTEEANALRSNITTFAWVSNGGWALAAAAGITAIVLFFVEGH